MKQENIIRNKLWDAFMNSKEVVFPIEFYSQKDVLNGLGSFDLRHVSFTFSYGKTEKNFDAYIIKFTKTKY